MPLRKSEFSIFKQTISDLTVSLLGTLQVKPIHVGLSNPNTGK